jgi:NAD(P)-dependent dehydrogenase (short-subunit alcohol dehydrogenase family)
MKIDDSIAAIVTGGASGLGAATVRTLRERGAKVAIFDRDAERGEAFAQNVGAVFCQVDITNQDSLDQAFARARGAHGQERILVNCAGIATGEKTAYRDKDSGAAVAHRLASFTKTIQVNLIGTFACIARTAAGLLDAKPLNSDGERGAIVNTASVAAEDGQIGQAAYAASKAGVKGMTLPIARDLMNDGIRVNTILPGILATPMLAGLPQNVQDSLAATVPFPKRLGEPAEFAALAVFLVENAYLNGAAIRLDGALRMGPR